MTVRAGRGWMKWELRNYTMRTSEWTRACGTVLKGHSQGGIQNLMKSRAISELDFQEDLGILITPVADTEKPTPQLV